MLYSRARDREKRRRHWQHAQRLWRRLDVRGNDSPPSEPGAVLLSGPFALMSSTDILSPWVFVAIALIFIGILLTDPLIRGKIRSVVSWALRGPPRKKDKNKAHHILAPPQLSSDSSLVVDELLATLDLTDLSNIPRARVISEKPLSPAEFKVVRIRVTEPAASINEARGIQMLPFIFNAGHEFDLIVNAQGQLIHIVPVVRRVEEEQWLHYIDLSSYYISINALQNRYQQEAWGSLAEREKLGQSVITVYQEKNYPNVRWFFPLMNYKPFRLVSINHRRKRIDIEGFTAEEAKNILSGKPVGTDWVIIPIYPTVYPFHAGESEDTDSQYWHTLLFDRNVKLKQGHRALVTGPGSGLDTWLTWTRTQRRVTVIGINPLEIANTRLTARIAGIDLEAIIGDNIVTEDGELRLDQTFDRVFWNMPQISFIDHLRPELSSDPNYETLWDGFNGIDALIKFAQGLPFVLSRKGRAMVWNEGLASTHFIELCTFNGSR
jgi:hypothetical protein